jgi:hypothetical protein
VKFLPPLLTGYPGKRLLVIHNWGAQLQGALAEWAVREAGGRLVFRAPLAYSPVLNPLGTSGTGGGAS